MQKQLPDISLLENLFTYNPKSGKLMRKETTNPRAVAGTEASSKTSHGYYRVQINKKDYRVHRIVWKMYYGKDPGEKFIDHINRNGLDNSIKNLRLVTTTQNFQNRGLSNRNKSGKVGVIWNKRDRRWTAGIVVDGKSIYLGNFLALTDAINARKRAEEKYFIKRAIHETSMANINEERG